MLTGKKRKNRYAKLNRGRYRRFIYILKIKCKGKSTVGKANKGINVEKIIGLKNQKLKLKKKKMKTPENCTSPVQRQRFITIKSVTEYTHIHIYP